MTIRIGMPANMQASLIFHYNLKFYDNDTDTFETISLKRFVMQVNWKKIRRLWNPIFTQFFKNSICSSPLLEMW